MDRILYQNEANHLNFVYQNPAYASNPYPAYQPTRHLATEKELPLATIYVRPQVYKGVNTPSEALKQGTAFSELYRPFVKRRQR